MKTSSVLLTCIATVTALLCDPTTFVTAAVAATDKCDATELITKLLPLLGDDNLLICQQDSDFVFFPFSGLPNEAQIAKLCTTKACQSLLKQAVEAELPSCELEYQGVTYNIKDTVDMFATMCLPPPTQ